MSSSELEKQLCNVKFEEFKDVYNIGLAEYCPACEIKGAFHERKTIIPILTVSESMKPSSTNVTSAFIKIQKLLPKFDKSDCREFLKQVERRLKFSDGIPQEKWTLVFLYIEIDSSSADWIERNIINEQLNWNEAKIKFMSHFQRADHRAQLKSRYDHIKQTSKESVQNYSDRFTDICEQLNRADDDFLIIDHYVKNLQIDIQKKFKERLTTVRLDKKDKEFEFDSLKEVIQICITYDIQDAGSGNYYSKPIATSDSNTNLKTETKLVTTSGNSSGTGKWCSIHESNTHDTNECFTKKKYNYIEPSTSKNTEEVECFKCKQFGHYANECPEKKKEENQNNTSGNTGIVQGRERRDVKPPVKLTYEKPGLPIDVTGRAVNVKNSQQPFRPSCVWFVDPISGLQFKCLVDTGADVSFIDKTLVQCLKLKVNAVSGKIRLAANKIDFAREGKTDRLPFISFHVMWNKDGADIASKRVDHSFEIMDLDTNNYQFIIGTDLLPLIFPTGIPLSVFSDVPMTGPSLCQISIEEGGVDFNDVNYEMSDYRTGPTVIAEVDDHVNVNSVQILDSSAVIEIKENGIDSNNVEIFFSTSRSGDGGGNAEALNSKELNLIPYSTVKREFIQNNMGNLCSRYFEFD
jgi:hypothetical protein